MAEGRSERVAMSGHRDDVAESVDEGPAPVDDEPARMTGSLAPRPTGDVDELREQLRPDEIDEDLTGLLFDEPADDR
jgi:hypothetical protein